MANQEQLEILKQGVDVWNKWRKENRSVIIDLFGADLHGVNLVKADLGGVNLSSADLGGTDLRWANLIESNLNQSNLNGANLRSAILAGAQLIDANLRETDFREGVLLGVDFRGAKLHQTNFEFSTMGGTNFGITNLTDAIGLEKIEHAFPSFVDTRAMQFSKGNLPRVFLRGCGLPDWEIESVKLHNPDITNEQIIRIQSRIYDLRASQPLQISPLFISYSHADKDFVDHLDSSLIAKGVRFWRDIHDAKAGRLETQIDRAIRQNPTVLLILSKNSIKSDWVEHEVRKARELEKELGRDALCPISLDDSWKSGPWPERLMEQIMEYNILDFSGWQDTPTFDSRFAKLLSGLEIFYKKSKA